MTVYIASDQAGIFPNETLLDTVQEYIDSLRPVTAEVFVVSPIKKQINIVINGLSPDTDTVRGAVKAAISDFLFNVATPGGTIFISQLRAAISGAAGEVDHVLVSPTENIVCSTGELAVLGDVTWQ